MMGGELTRGEKIKGWIILAVMIAVMGIVGGMDVRTMEAERKHMGGVEYSNER